MPRLWTLLLAALLFCAPQLTAQAAAQDFTFHVSADETWTDTSLDLQSGDVLEISASPAAPASPGAPACDPKGTGGNAAQAADLPLPAAPAGALIARLHSQGAAPLLVG
ncbi:MAG TPA: hypothetical protein VEE87_00180, partial [archaeon]|nr:hypothetical protein [archaeon]